MEPSSLKRQHAKAIQQATALLRVQTGRAPHMDPWTLAYLAGHRDMNITKRYVHP